MRALSIRQPYAELILRGMKTIEYRSQPTRIIGERFWIYASLRRALGGGKKSVIGGPLSVVKSKGVWSSDVAMPGDGDAALPWMAELANALRLFPHDLPTGVIVGSAVIERCERVAGWQPPAARGRAESEPATSNSQSATLYHWHLADVRRAKKFRKPIGHPQPVWFKPF